ncbi:hypothetical protein [Tsuneonella suprasediminis]|uniref:hypothetical protein n=1 Tax=Tsuneonella suprasediminis TaxID=2306996 RepID=UPI002F9400F0
MTDDSARRYAVNLLNRLSDQPFEQRDVAVLAQIVPLIEHDTAAWLNNELRGTVSRCLIVSAVRNGQARPASDAKEGADA